MAATPYQGHASYSASKAAGTTPDEVAAADVPGFKASDQQQESQPSEASGPDQSGGDEESGGQSGDDKSGSGDGKSGDDKS